MSNRILPFSIVEEHTLVLVDGTYYMHQSMARQWLLWEPFVIYLPFIWNNLPIIILNENEPAKFIIV